MGRSAFSLRASIGIALYPAHGLDAETLLRHAETAKYAAVASRRDYLVYEPSLDDARTEASRLIAELHGALTAGTLKTDALAAFGQVDFAVTDTPSLNAGGSYSGEKQTVEELHTGRQEKRREGDRV